MRLRRSCGAINDSPTSHAALSLLLSAIVVIASAALSCSCSTTGCTENRSSIPMAGFYDSTTKSAIAIDSIDVGGVGAPADSLLLASPQRAQQVYMPLRSERDVAAFYIAYRQKALDYPQLIDTITFGYDAIPYFASEECGAMMRYRIRRVDHTRHLLDSVAIVPADSVITNADIENVRLYFKTSSTTADIQ